MPANQQANSGRSRLPATAPSGSFGAGKSLDTRLATGDIEAWEELRHPCSEMLAPEESA